MADEKKLEEELASFRREWKEEIRRTVTDSGSSRNSPSVESPSPSSREGSPSPLLLETKNSSNTTSLTKEEKATQLFSQGVSAERRGNVYEALHFYRRAVQLVPDIESRMIDFTNNLMQDEEDSDNETDYTYNVVKENQDTCYLTDLTKKFNSLSVTGICQPQYETRMTHISAIPLELIVYIFKWVVSSELDMKSLEQLARVCKGFSACARDPEIWKLACKRLWGVNCGSAAHWNGCWRLMYIKRPHVLFVGVYISKTSYVKQGERSLDCYYRPFHVVEYYRYMRFFSDGTVVLHTSADEPTIAIQRLKVKLAGSNSSVSVGHYRLNGDKVTIVVNKKMATESNKGRRTRGPPPLISEQIFHMELQIKSTKRNKHHNQLTWLYYSISTKYRSSGQTVCSQLDLNNQFPPLYFSAVKSISNSATAPLQ